MSDSSLRFGFTTGSCAAAAAKAGAYMLLTGQKKETISIMTPKGIEYIAKIENITKNENEISCTVIKDGGDDPDVTTGANIVATVKINDDGGPNREIIIDGGRGVGRVTKPGLDQPVGNAAINSVPRKMIHDEVSQVCDICDFNGTVYVVISVTQGQELALKTFNSRLGIEGGISILGTSGIVEPMSSKALIDTIKVELSQRRAMGIKDIAIAPGNYGLDFMREQFDFDIDKSVKCSNFIGDTIDMVVDMQFRSMLLTGHIGKLIKLSGGIMNTHSANADCRMELIAAATIACLDENKLDIPKKILGMLTTTQALELLYDNDILDSCMQYIMDKILFYLNKRANGKIKIECIMYDNQFGLLAASQGALKMMETIK